MATKKIDWEDRFFQVAEDLFTRCNNDYTLDDAIERAYEFIERLKEFESDNNL